MNASAPNDETPGRQNEEVISPPRIDMHKFPSASTPDYCPFSVEVEPSCSNSFDYLRLSTVSKSWSLAMRTTGSSNLIDTGDSEDKDDADDEFPLNEMDTDIVRALSNEKAPVGLTPISSDSESSSRDESLDIDSDDEEGAAMLLVVPTALGAGSSQRQESYVPCALSPRLSRTPTRGDVQRNAQQEATPGAAALANPLNPLKVLNPGVPQGHANHRHHKRHNSMSGKSRVAGTPQRGDSNALVTSNSNVATTTSADCMCFAIEDLTQFFCPATPKSTTIDNTTPCTPGGMDCFPDYDYGATYSPIALSGPFNSIQGFWASPNNSPLPRSRQEQSNSLFLLNANLPRNRSHCQRRKHVRKLLAVWHGAEDDESARFGSQDDFHLVDKLQQRRKRSSLAQSKCCYDSDPEQEVRGKVKRRSSLLSSNRFARSHKAAAGEGDVQQPHFRKFRPQPFTHLDTDEETTSEDDESSYETAKCTSEPPSHPAAPRNSDPSNMSFDFGNNLASVDLDGNAGGKMESTLECGSTSAKPKTEKKAGVVAFEFGKSDNTRSTIKGHRREPSTTSLSTTGHSRFHTIRMSPEQVQVGPASDSSESSSAGFSSISGSTTLNNAHNGASKKRQHHQLPSYFKSYPTHWTEFQLLFSRNVDEESVKSHVHELSNVRFPLVWHPGALSPPPTSSSGSAKANGKTTIKAVSAGSMHCSPSVKIASLSNNASRDTFSEVKPSSRKSAPFPISVQGAFEVGAHLENMVVQPKFAWMPLAQPHRIEEGTESNHRELFLSGSAPPQVELLSIIRVNKADAKQLDKNLYPYARRDRTCIVSTNDANHPTIVLEARSTQERDWLVFSLKLIVARLASIIITRDEDMLHEFFSPYSALMQLEEEEESVLTEVQEVGDKLPPHQSKGPNASVASTIECAGTPTASCSKAGVVIDGEGSNGFVFPQDTEEDEQSLLDDESSTDSDLLDDEDRIRGDDVVETNDVNGAYQVRDDREIQDSIRARNSGAYAILTRSLTATGPLVDFDDHEEPMPRTFSF